MLQKIPITKARVRVRVRVRVCICCWHCIASTIKNKQCSDTVSLTACRHICLFQHIKLQKEDSFKQVFHSNKVELFMYKSKHFCDHVLSLLCSLTMTAFTGAVCATQEAALVLETEGLWLCRVVNRAITTITRIHRWWIAAWPLDT